MISKKENMRNEIRSNMRGGNGDITLIHMIEKADMMGKIQLAARVQIPVGGSVGKHAHEKDAEIVIVVSGTVMAEENDSAHILSAGDIMFTGGGDSHSFTNYGDTILELIGIIIE